MGRPLSSDSVCMLSMGSVYRYCHLETGMAGRDFFRLSGSDASPHSAWDRVLLSLFLVGRELSRSLKNLFWIKK
ncbi:hypothetical protein ACU6QO_10000 [Aeromonas veronii]|uniref:hypothetical protein n=1 Tax=Aeromonas veronii TaxID=654 RepID=UPI00406CFD55